MRPPPHGPEPRNGADQRAFSRAGFSRDQHPLSAHDGNLSLVDDRGAIIERDRKVVQSQLRRSLPLDPLNAAEVFAGFRLLQRVY